MDLGQFVHGAQKLMQEAGLAFNTMKPEVAKERLRDLSDLMDSNVELFEIPKEPEPIEKTQAEQAAFEAIQGQAETEADGDDPSFHDEMDHSTKDEKATPGPEAQPSEQ